MIVTFSEQMAEVDNYNGLWTINDCDNRIVYKECFAANSGTDYYQSDEIWLADTDYCTS